VSILIFEGRERSPESAMLSGDLNLADKPGSVVNGHLSAPCVAAGLRDRSRATRGNTSGKHPPYGVASDRVYSKPMLP